MTAAWVGAVRALFGEWPQVIVVAGPGAPELASSFHADGAPPPSGEAGGMVILARSDPPPGISGVADLPESWADLVVLRSAWRERTEVSGILRSAEGALRSGGRLFAAEFDLARLLETSAVRYPSRLLFAARPELASEARTTTIGRAMLAAEAVRAGLADVDVVDLEEERGTFPSADAYWRYARGGGWPALAWLSAAEAERTMEGAADDLARIAPIGPVVDRVPFVGVTGTRR